MIKIGSCFSGIGCFEWAAEKAIPNSETVWQIEIEPFARRVLSRHWPRTTRYEDIKLVNPDELEPVDILVGGFPCQDLSIANKEGKGLDGKKSGLWFEMWRIIRSLRTPSGRRPIAIIENVPMLINRKPGLDIVLGCLADIGYDAEWTTLSAGQMGAPHKRNRVWICAYPSDADNGIESDVAIDEPLTGPPKSLGIVSESTHADVVRSLFRKAPESIAFKESARVESDRGTVSKDNDATDAQSRKDLREQGREDRPKLRRCGITFEKDAWGEFPFRHPFYRGHDGGPGDIHRAHRLKALGNGIVPQVAYEIIKRVYESGLIR